MDTSFELNSQYRANKTSSPVFNGIFSYLVAQAFRSQIGYGKGILRNKKIVIISEWFTNKRIRRISRYG
jgi:hypothetical protein